MKRSCVIGVLFLALSGCASIFSGTTQDVAIRSTPGAKFMVTNSYGSPVASGVVGEDSLVRANLVRGAGYFSPHAYKVRLNKPGYRPAMVEVDPGMNPWYFGNILLGGFIGMVIVDPLTGAMFRLVPRTDDAILTATGEDVAALEHEAAIVKNSMNNPVSRNDYMARQKVKTLRCEPIGNPAVTDLNTGAERLSFICRDGRLLTLACGGAEACRAL